MRKSTSHLGVRLTAMIAGLSIGLLGVPTSAQATVSNTSATLQATTACDQIAHTVRMGANITLSNRFPNGTYVAVHYKYWWTNLSGQAISQAYVTPWLYSNVGPSTYRSGSVTYVNMSYSLPIATRIKTGVLRTAAQVGVWNGSYYEYSRWDVTAVYNNTGSFGINTSDGVCLASIT